MTKIEKGILATIVILVVFMIISMWSAIKISNKALACYDYGTIHKVETNYILSKEACYLDGKEIKIDRSN